MACDIATRIVQWKRVYYLTERIYFSSIFSLIVIVEAIVLFLLAVVVSDRFPVPAVVGIFFNLLTVPPLNKHIERRRDLVRLRQELVPCHSFCSSIHRHQRR
jgi:hypothetical protein